ALMNSRVALALALLLFATACATVAPDDCSLKFRGQSRKEVKLRDPDNKCCDDYEHVTMTVEQLLDLGCHLQPLSQQPSETQAMLVEKRIVTVTAYVMAVRFERLGPFMDQDFHVQISDSPNWFYRPHIVVEVPPGDKYCEA